MRHFHGVRGQGVRAAGVLVGLIAALAVPACEATGRDGIASDASAPGSDAGSPTPEGDSAVTPPLDASGTVTGDSSTIATACTAPPFIGFGATVTKLHADGTSAPFAGLRVGFSTCQGFELTTDGSGKASTQLTQAIAVSAIYADNSAISALGAEMPASADVAAAVQVFDFDVASRVPGFASDAGQSPVLEVVLGVDAAASAPCNSTDGVTLTVNNHPEAIVSYMGAAWPTNAAIASTTASTGGGKRAFIHGVQGATKVGLAGTKSGCVVRLITASQTGEFQLVPQSITVGTATITN